MYEVVGVCHAELMGTGDDARTELTLEKTSVGYGGGRLLLPSLQVFYHLGDAP